MLFLNKHQIFGLTPRDLCGCWSEPPSAATPPPSPSLSLDSSKPTSKYHTKYGQKTRSCPYWRKLLHLATKTTLSGHKKNNETPPLLRDVLLEMREQYCAGNDKPIRDDSISCETEEITQAQEFIVEIDTIIAENIFKVKLLYMTFSTVD